uniref:Uncharacterized protein n=1 Tax=Globodera rostochiensis TaxID=31243 RepID=A0A914HVQ2_GLORO
MSKKFETFIWDSLSKSTTTTKFALWTPEKCPKKLEVIDEEEVPMYGQLAAEFRDKIARIENSVAWLQHGQVKCVCFEHFSLLREKIDALEMNQLKGALIAKLEKAQKGKKGNFLIGLANK